MVILARTTKNKTVHYDGDGAALSDDTLAPPASAAWARDAVCGKGE